EHPYIVYDFTANRQGEHPRQFLRDYHGHVQADAYSGYDELFQKASVTEVGCWAHARRYFFDHKNVHPALAHEALARIGQLYAIEKEAKEKQLDEAGVLALRQQQAVPLLTSLCQWLRDQQALVLPKNPMAQAIGYTLNQWPALTRYTTAGF